MVWSDFADNSLFAGDAVDITGNDLFGQVTLGLPANVVSYSQRVGVIGNTIWWIATNRRTSWSA
jgi:hypothetical protein